MVKELVSGKVLNVVRFLKDEIEMEINSIKLNDFNFECDGVEQVKKTIDEYLEIINGIYQDILGDYINYDTIILVVRDSDGKLGYSTIDL